MEYITAKKAAEKWNITKRRVTTLCEQGRVEGAQRFGTAWAIPENTQKPADARIKSGKYIGTRKDKNIETRMKRR